MPARDAVLRRQRVEVAGCQEPFASVFALALEAERHRFAFGQDVWTGDSSLSPCGGCTVSNLGAGLENLFENFGPEVKVFFGEVKAKVL